MNSGARIWTQVSWLLYPQCKSIRTLCISLNCAVFHISHFCFPLYFPIKVRNKALKVGLMCPLLRQYEWGNCFSYCYSWFHFVVLYYNPAIFIVQYWRHTDAILCPFSSCNTKGIGNAWYELTFSYNSGYNLYRRCCIWHDLDLNE